MKSILLTLKAIVLCMLYGCAPLHPPVITKQDTLNGYKYVYISTTSNLSSSTGAVIGGEYGIYGVTESKSVNPADVITGILLKKGYTKIPELKPELLHETLIVNYGESGKRKRMFGYTIEVTIQIISAKTYTQICSCTAEGQGDTEADDIRQAITRCLSGLL